MKKSLLVNAVLCALGSVGIVVNAQTIDATTSDYTNSGNVILSGENEVINVQSGHSVTLSGPKITINVENRKNAEVKGVRAGSGNSNVTNRIILGSNKTETVSVNVDNTKANSLTSGIIAQKNGLIEVNSNNFIVDVQGNQVKDTYGISAQGFGGKEDPLLSKLVVNAENTVINVSGNPSGSAAIMAYGRGHVQINGNVEINTDENANSYAIVSRSWSLVQINPNGGASVKMNGNIAFAYNEATAGTPIDANVIVNLDTPDSYWHGSSEVAGNPPVGKDNVTGMELHISNKAKWITDAPSFINSLQLDEGTINITNDKAIIDVDYLSGHGTVNLATDLKASEGKQAGTLIVEAADEKASLNVNLMDTKLEKQLTADEINADQAKKLMANVGGTDGKNVVSTSTAVPEGMVNPAFGVDAEGKTHTASANTLMQSSLELASAAPLALNRIMMNDVRKRLGDIRTTEGTHGAWARYDGGKLSGEGGLENDFHTVQVGIDTVPTADSARMGVAFSYTDSDAEYARGSADMKAYSIAMYGTKVFDNGMFVDVIGRMGTADSDLTVDGQYKGTLDNVVLGVSGEFGWRFDVTNSMYIEPQAELSYAYVNGDKLTLGTAEYDVDSVNSLLGRVGFAAGLKCPSDMGNVYVRASAVHEFLGDSKITGANAGHTNVYEIDGKDTWVEYGLGANFNVTKSTYMWADVERTTGGALDEDWRATVGVRYAW